METHILDIIREVSEADFVFILTNDNLDNCFVKSQSNLSENIDKNAYLNILNTIILPIIENQKIKIHQYPWNLTNLSQVAKLNSV